jgi:hypothetical protein
MHEADQPSLPVPIRQPGLISHIHAYTTRGHSTPSINTEQDNIRYGHVWFRSSWAGPRGSAASHSSLGALFGWGNQATPVACNLQARN